MRISLLILIGMLSLLLYSCAAGACDNPPYTKSPDSVGKAPFTPPKALDDIPTPDSYDKTTSFDSLTYRRPDTAALIVLIEQADELARSESTSYDELAAAIEKANDSYTDFSTMLTYLTLKTSADSSDSFYAAEYSLLTESATKIKDAVEELFVSAAGSKHAQRLENEIFGEGFVEKYSSEKLTDRAVELLRAETALENEYRELSPSTVMIRYDGKHASYSAIRDYVSRLYSSKSEKCAAELSKCEKLYKTELERNTKRIFIELLRVRRLIADELGYDSYTEYAYETIYHDYSPEDMENFCENVAKYVIPVISGLDDKVFYNYFTKNAPSAIDVTSLTSALGSVYRGIDRDLAGIYGFMEHYSLLDVAKSSQNRDNGAYTTYIDGLSAPFIFMSAEGSLTDYSVLSHEFGHFYDSFINKGTGASMDLLEVSSTSLELLTLNMLERALDEEDYRYLHYYQMRRSLNTMIYQSFYSTFEHLAYSLDYTEITEEKLCELVREAAKEMNLPMNYFNDLGYVLTDHTILYPHYSQSYALSLIPSLEIYFAECEENGRGLELYKMLVNRDGDNDFISQIKMAQLSSPFDEEHIKSIVDNIHFSILGYHYYKNEGNQNAA
ncbi:MAG: hypothetical protein IJW03_03750 [Clostridia bacterium]|nr:hypothetical protein [Clostridia bacterium]